MSETKKPEPTTLPDRDSSRATLPEREIRRIEVDGKTVIVEVRRRAAMVLDPMFGSTPRKLVFGGVTDEAEFLR